jgi:YD repeat-containing protein
VNYRAFELTYSYSYYKNGQKKSLTMPDGTTYEYTYDNNNQLSVISIPGQGFFTYNQYTIINGDVINGDVGSNAT